MWCVSLLTPPMSWLSDILFQINPNEFGAPTKLHYSEVRGGVYGRQKTFNTSYRHSRQIEINDIKKESVSSYI